MTKIRHKLHAALLRFWQSRSGKILTGLLVFWIFSLLLPGPQPESEKTEDQQVAVQAACQRTLNGRVAVDQDRPGYNVVVHYQRGESAIEQAYTDSRGEFTIALADGLGDHRFWLLGENVEYLGGDFVSGENLYYPLRYRANTYQAGEVLSIADSELCSQIADTGLELFIPSKIIPVQVEGYFYATTILFSGTDVIDASNLQGSIFSIWPEHLDKPLRIATTARGNNLSIEKIQTNDSTARRHF